MHVPEYSTPEAASPIIEQREPRHNERDLAKLPALQGEGASQAQWQAGLAVRLRDVDGRVEGHLVAGGCREARHSPGRAGRGPDIRIAPSVLKQGMPLILHAMIEAEGFG